MSKKLYWLITAGVLVFKSPYVKDKFKLMIYNVLNFPSENVAPNFVNDLQRFSDDYRPNNLMFCELHNEAEATTILSPLQQFYSNFHSALFKLNTSDNNLDQIIKTIKVNNSFVEVDTSQFTHGICYNTSKTIDVNPLKFIVTH